MDFIWNSFFGFFIAWNYWSIVPIVIIIVLGAVAYKSIITPKEYQDRVAWEQARENRRLSQPKIRRIATTFLISAVSLMGATFFCIAIYKMFE